MTIMPDSCRMATISQAARPAGSREPRVWWRERRHHTAFTLPFSASENLSITAAWATLPVPISISCSPTITTSASLPLFPSQACRLNWLGCCSFTFQVPARMEIVRRWTTGRSRAFQADLRVAQPPGGMTEDQPVTVPLAPMEYTRVPATAMAVTGPRWASQEQVRVPCSVYTRIWPSIRPAQMCWPTTARQPTPDRSSSRHSCLPAAVNFSMAPGRQPTHSWLLADATSAVTRRAAIPPRASLEVAPAKSPLSAREGFSGVTDLPFPALLPPPKALPNSLPNLASILAPFLACSVLFTSVLVPPIVTSSAMLRTAPRPLSMFIIMSSSTAIVRWMPPTSTRPSARTGSPAVISTFSLLLPRPTPTLPAAASVHRYFPVEDSQMFTWKLPVLQMTSAPEEMARATRLSL
mmetsp:Transcript_32418/g.91880  ORF Transcript_32418/g.91880 Transcript_32418/m.91880 type:complete len:409 (-) Transcript_32418:1421-2647(-)